jgi:hypothetical protein
MIPRHSGPRSRGVQQRPLLGVWFLLFLFIESACATHAPWGSLTPSYRYASLTPPPAPREYVTLTPRGDFAPVQVSEADFRESFTRLVLEMPLPVASHSARPLTGCLVLASWPPGGAGDTRVEAGYGRLCERRHSPGDCFHLLGDGPGDTTLSHRDRFALSR